MHVNSIKPISMSTKPGTVGNSTIETMTVTYGRLDQIALLRDFELKRLSRSVGLITRPGRLRPQPLSNHVHHGLQPLVVDPLAVETRHILASVAHDVVNGRLVL